MILWADDAWRDDWDHAMPEPGTVTVFEPEPFEEVVETGLLDHKGEPILRRTRSAPRRKIGFWTGY